MAMRWARSLFRVLAALALCVVIALTALVLALDTAPARSLARTLLERLLDDLCSGDVQLDRVAKLSLAGTQVEGVTVHDAQGRTVLHARHLSLGLDLPALFGFALRFSHGRLDDARIRAIPSEESAITLFEALAPAPSAPGTPSGGPSRLRVLFEHIHVVRAHLYGSVPGLADLEAVGLEARGAIRIERGELSVRVDQARCDLTRPFGHALTLEHGTFSLDTTPLRLTTKARVRRGPDRVRVALSYRAPEGLDETLDLLVGLDPVSPELLIDLGIAPAEVLLSSLRGHARLYGPLRWLALSAALVTDGGSIALTGSLPEGGPSELRIASPELALAPLIAYAPPLSLRMGLDVRVEPAGAVHMHLSAPTLSLFGIELSEADLAGTYADERLTLEGARIRYGSGHFDLSGWVDADANLSLRVRSRIPDVARDARVRELGLRGSLRTDVHVERRSEALAISGSIGIEAPAYAGVAAKEMVLEGSARARGDFSRARVNLHGASWGTTLLDHPIGDIEFRIRGGSPHFSADFDLIDGRARTALAHLELDVERDGYHVLLSPLELGVPLKEPWRARADLTIEDDGITFHELLLANGPQRLALHGRYDFVRAYRLDATLQSFDLGGLRLLSGLDLADLDGTIDGRLALTGVPGQPRIDAQGSLHSGVFLGMRDLTLLVSLSSVERRFDLDAELVLPDQSRIAVYAGGEPGAGASWLAQIGAGNYRFGVDFERVPFSVGRPWLEWLGLEPPPGTMSATVRGAGTLAAPYLELKSRVAGVVLGDWPALDLDLDLEHDGTRASLHALRVGDAHGTIAELEGYLEAQLGELLSPLSLRGELATRPLELLLQWKDRRLDELPAPMRLNLALPTSGTLRITQTREGPLLDAHVGLGWSEASAGIDACGTMRRPIVELTLAAHDLRTTGKLTASVDGEQLAMADIEADTPIVAWLRGDEPLSLPRTSLTLNAETQASEEIPLLCEYVAGPLRLDVSALDAFADPPELQIALRSHGLQLVASEQQRQRLGALRSARSAGRPFAVALTGGVQGASLVLRGDLTQSDGGRLELGLSLPRALFVGAPAGPSWPLAEAQLDAERFELASLLVGLPISVRGSGLLAGHARASYDAAERRVSLAGGLSLRAGTLVLGSLGQELSDVSGRVVLAEQRIRIEELSARDFDGRVSVRGELELEALDHLESDLALTLDEFPIRRESAQVSRLTGGMQLRATMEPMRTRAELTVGELRVSLPNDLGQGLQPLGKHADIVVRGEEPAEVDPDPHLFELRVLAQNPPFRVLRSDLSAEVSGDLTVRYRAPSLTLLGSAEIQRGSFELYGKRFELGESRLAFDGSEALDPLVSLDAVHHTSTADISIRVEGRLSEPKISFAHSNPAITEPGEIIAQLLGARSSDPATRDRDATGAAAGILAGATAGLLTQEVRQEFGGALPVLSLESSSQTLSSARIRAGVQLDQLIERRLGRLRNVVQGAYVEGFVAPGATTEADNPAVVPQSRSGGLLELRFPKDLVGTIEYRPIQNWRLDLAWEP